MSWVFYYQLTPESEWLVEEAKNREHLIASVSPAFTTALDLNAEVTDDMKREDLDAVHYKGDLYFDFDSDDIEECIPRFNEFLSKLTEIGIDLRQVGLYASGGKGFHVIVPTGLFLDKPNGSGFKFLPLIYKEIAQELYVDCLDMRVYSARRGRMFRTNNVLRANGKYKVQLSVAEARSITVDLYDELTSSDRQPFVLNPPVFNPELARMFSDAREKVNEAVKKRRSSKKDEKLIEQFSGNLPESLLMIGRGEKVKEGVGFQRIATQIAITTVALGKSETEMLEACETLIENHQSDGTRYNTPLKRKKELMRMYHYMSDNPCYEFSAGGIKSLLEKGTPTPDLDIEIDDPNDALSEDDELELDDHVTKGVRFNKNGIFVKVWNKEEQEYRILKCSDIGMDKIALMRELESGESIGFEYDAFLSGQRRGRRQVSMSSITSAHSLQTAVGNVEGGAIQLNDAQAKALLDLMRKKAEVRNAVVSTVPREGLDLVTLPDTDTETNRKELIYAGPSHLGVINAAGEAPQYRLSTVNRIDGEFKSDLLSAPIFEGTTQDEEYFRRFFATHPPAVISRTFGYYLACFLAQIIRHEKNYFPVLQVFGEAGTGKTSYNMLMSCMHYYNKQPVVWSAGSVTPFALTALLQSSASIPVVFDELKRRELGIRRVQEFLMIIRNNYTGNSGGKGRVSRDSGVSTLSIDRSANVAPMVFIAEELETQTAVLDRSVGVYMPTKITGDEGGHFNYCWKNRQTLGRFGRLCVAKALKLDIEKMGETLEDFRVQLSESFAGQATARPIFNNAVILTGLEFGRQVLESVFGDKFNDQMEAFKAEISTDLIAHLPENKSESNKVLDTLAQLSGKPLSDPLMLEMEEDYCLSKDRVTEEPCVDIHLANAWDKYTRYRRAQGEQPLYATEGAFINAMERHNAVMDVACIASPLKKGRPSVRVVRLSLRRLYEENKVEEFSNLEKEKVM